MNYDFARLLDPSPMALEVGYRRLDNGVFHVAVRTDMHKCSGAMLEWWFGSRPETREYRWWHPADHISSSWEEGEKGNAIGSIHVAEERFCGSPPAKLRIQFRDPVEIFGAAQLEAARSAGHVSGLLTAFSGPGEGAQRTPEGVMIGSRLVHVARDTEWGMVLRSHFLLGFDLPGLGVPAPALAEMFPDQTGPLLLQHCYDEFTMLSRILPGIYAAEGISPDQVKRPW